MHAIETLHGSRQRARQADGAGIVHQDINSAECIDCFGCRGADLLLEADVNVTGRGFPARGLDLRGSSVDRSGELRMRFDRLGCYYDISALSRRAQSNRFADATAGASDE